MQKETRLFNSFELRAMPEGQEKWVEGYAVIFNSPSPMWEYEGTEHLEQIDSRAFDGAEMRDVIFNYNHGGKVLARTRNKTLELKLDETGLFVRARLDGTDEGRKLYEEIRGGYIDKMSFAFTVEEDSYNKDLHTRTISKIKRLYDVSAVDIPAYADTSISARNYFETQNEAIKKHEYEIRKKRLALLASL
jgi:HK97 family phage prohead protease